MPGFEPGSEKRSTCRFAQDKMVIGYLSLWYTTRTLHERTVCILGLTTYDKPCKTAPHLGFQMYLHGEET